MSLSLEAKRTRIDTTLALCVAFTIVLLGLIVNFGQRISQFFVPHARFPAVTFLLNFLCAWLTVLLGFVFVRWRRTERMRREVESIISSISPDALLVVDCSRRIRVCNNSLVRMFGYTPGEILNRTTDLLYDDRRVDPVNRPREIYEALERDGYHIGTAVGRRKSGETFPLEIISAELSGREGAVLLLRDITERVRAAQEKERLEEQLRQREKLQSMGLMASGIAHDLNNFLTVVNGNTELARVALGRNQTLP
ncbi:MAG: PAS domain S-box protein [Kiritimatiellia bacterium]